jgi:hypothetical protein
MMEAYAKVSEGVTHRFSETGFRVRPRFSRSLENQARILFRQPLEPFIF